MGKLKGIKIPRKLKKEVWKIECWKREAPSFRSGMHIDPFGRGDSRYSFGTFMPRELLKGKHLIPLEDGYHYKREIQGIIKTKIVYGKINKQRKSDSRFGEDS